MRDKYDIRIRIKIYNVKDIEKNRNLFEKTEKSYQSDMISLFSLWESSDIWYNV